MPSSLDPVPEAPCQRCGFTTDTTVVRRGGVEYDLCRGCATKVRAGRPRR